MEEGRWLTGKVIGGGEGAAAASRRRTDGGSGERRSETTARGRNARVTNGGVELNVITAHGCSGDELRRPTHLVVEALHCPSSDNLCRCDPAGYSCNSSSLPLLVLLPLLALQPEYVLASYNSLKDAHTDRNCITGNTLQNGGDDNIHNGVLQSAPKDSCATPKPLLLP
ncbi:hypothetical protein F2Q69_00012133 [Brassica cretica]|uniref:Uncharacterized protein n=1 Tax=Brassica cretica TaxID=69181 RepID=A0A8S9R7W9_BRACR|nr:hypothetical protein F2Q69_00012133 [Brassica cretica]